MSKFLSSRFKICFAILLGFLSLAVPLSAQTSHWLTGYYATYNYSVMSTSQVDYTKLTHIIYWPVIPNSGPAGSATAPGTLNTTPFGLSPTTFANGATDLVTRAHAAGVKALIGIGGDQSSGATAGFQISTNPTYQATFIKNIVALMEQYGFDGVDINWEQIQTSDNSDFTTFITNLRAALTTASPNVHLLLTMPPETKPNGGRPDLLEQVYQDLDQINIQTYQMSGPYCGWETWYNSPLNNGGATFILVSSEQLPSTTNAIADYTSLGIPQSKLAFGLQFDASVWTGGQGTSTGGVTQPKQTWTNDSSSCSSNPYAPNYSTLAYRLMITELTAAAGYTTNFDSVADQSWLSYDPSGTGTTNESKDSFVSFDSPTSIAKKGVDMSASAGAGGPLGGVFIFELSGDYASTAVAAQQHPLLNATHSMQMLLPGLVTNLKATAATGSATLTWTAAPFATGYTVLYSTSATGTNTTGPTVTTDTATITNLTAGQEYWFEVRPTNTFGNGPATSQVTATIPSLNTPTVTWATPASIAYGTPLSATQLDATASVAGTFVYTPAKGTVLPVGSNTLSVTFTPANPSYSAVTKTVTETVASATLLTNRYWGNVNVGAQSNAHAITFTFAAASSVTSIQVVTGGATGLDFQIANGGSCAAGKSYAAGSSCTVNVTFAPTVAGTRAGAAVLQLSNGTAATAYLYGPGVGPQLTYDPAAQTQVPLGTTPLGSTVYASGLAIDSVGNLYYSSSYYTNGHLGTVTKVTPAGVSSTYASNLAYSPTGLAFDGAGNLYIALNTSIVKVTPSGAITTIVSGMLATINRPLAVDPTSGTLYIDDTLENQVLKVTPAGVESTFLSGTVLGTSLSQPQGLAVDGSGNVYISDTGNSRILKVNSSGGNPSLVSVAGLARPGCLAIGSTGNLYIINGYQILKLTPSGLQTTILNGVVNGSVAIYPYLIAIDSYENLSYYDLETDLIFDLNRAAPPAFSFASTTVNSVSSDTPKIVTVENMGNAPLTVNPPPAYGYNASLTGSDDFYFVTANNANTCPVLYNTPTATSLAAGASCNYALGFVPTSVGGTAGELTLTDNALNVAGSSQTFPVQGTGLPGTPATVTLSGLSAVYTGSPIPVTATTSPTGLSVSITYNGYSNVPTQAGTYTVDAIVTSAGYSGSATGTLVISYFGSVEIPAKSNAQAIPVYFTAADTISSIQTLTMGAAGLDFQSVAGGTCKVGQAYPANGSCTVLVTFTPSVTGTRRGAVVVTNKTSSWTAFLSGTGAGPQVTFDPGTQTTITTSELASSIHFTSDGNGNTFYTNPSAGSVMKRTSSGTVSTYLSGLGSTIGPLAMDGTGSLFIALPGKVDVYLPAGAYEYITVGGATDVASGIAIDPASGNRYIADSVNGTIYEEAYFGGGVSTFLSGMVLGSNLNGIGGLAVDSAGSVYLSDTGNARVLKIQGGSPSSIGTGYFKAPYGIALGGNGDLFVADSHANVLEITASGNLITNYTSSALGTDVSVDGYENLLVSVTASNGTQNLVSLNRNTPPTFNFATTAVGSTSSDSPNVLTVTDIGTDSLVFPAPQNANSGLTMGFNLAKATTCPDTFTSGTPQTSMPAGTSCTYAINFSPTTDGSYAGSMTLLDNSLNVSNAKQVIPLNGRTTVLPATVTLSGLSATYTGSPIAAKATTSPAGLTVSITYAGSTTAPTNAGSYAVVATVTSSGYTGSATGTLVIAEAAPTVTWATPASIAYGTPLSATQLDATASVPGAFDYEPGKGTVLLVGSNTLSVTFKPTSLNYAAVTKTVSLTVTPATLLTNQTWGNVNVGAQSNAHAITFTFGASGSLVHDTASPITNIQVLTGGAPNLDFQLANGGTCSVGQSYAAGSSCTVNVTFSPKAPGTRVGAAVLQFADGPVTALLNGPGVAPQLAFDPGTQSFIPFSIPNLPNGLAFDGAGDLYYASCPNTPTGTGTVTKLTPGGLSSTVISGLPGDPTLALDGAGNLFVGLGTSVLKVTPAGVTTTFVSGITSSPAGAIAVDPTTGNLYVTLRTSILKVTPAGVQSTFLSGTVLGSALSLPSGVAVDGSGNVYVADNGNNRILKVTSAGSAALLPLTGVQDPKGLAVGGTGNLYIVNQGGVEILELTPAGVQSAPLEQSGVSIDATQIAVDSSEDIYIADVMGQHVTELNRQTPPSLAFASTNVGSISSDSPAVVSVQNIGNAALTVNPPSSGTNAAISAGFTFAAANTCPVLTTTSAAKSLAAGASCNYAINFQPVAAGAASGDLTLTDNNLSVAGSQQAFPLSGTGIAPTKATVTLTGLSATYTGSPIAVTATTSPAGLSVSITYGGSATAPTKAGSYAVVATVTSAGYSGSASGTLVIAKATPVITWATPAPITSGTVLSATQLNATSSVAGSFAYSPAAGTTPAVGTDTLTTTFTPTDTTDYNTATAKVSLVVNAATGPQRVVWIPDYYGGLLQVRVGTTPTAITISLPTCNPNAVAVNSNKAYVVCNASGDNPDKILVYNATTIRAAPAGTLTISPLQTITSSEFSSLIGIAFDASNNLWVASNGNNQIDSISAATLNTTNPVVKASLVNSPSGPVSLVFDGAGGMWVVGQYAGGILLHLPSSQIQLGGNATPDYCLATSNASGCQVIDNVFLSPEGVALYNGDVWVASNSTGQNGNVPAREIVDLKFSGGTLTVNATFGNSAVPADSPFVCPGGLYASSSHLWVNDESYGETNPQCGAAGDVASKTGGIFAFTPAQLAAQTTTISQVLAFSNITGRPGFGGIFVEND